MAFLREKLLRQASAMRLDGTGAANGISRVSLLRYFTLFAETGNTVMPKPLATILRIVSSELPCCVSPILLLS